jgi:ATP-dependent exoDNAse (exonuclease V) alpha subunit
MESEIISFLAFEPTSDQQQAIQQAVKLIEDKNKKRKVFLLKGYAGTGKTYLVSAIIKAFEKNKKRTILMAPTGRAAKVMSGYASKQAFTIHRFIFGMEADKEGIPRYFRKPNTMANTLFFVDEASMLQDGMSGAILKDLVSYVFEQENNILFLIGDEAQLPPVGQEKSYALDAVYLHRNYGLDVEEATLKEVVRQQEGSGVLYNATQLRDAIGRERTPTLKVAGYGDVFTMDHTKLEDGLRYAYDKFGIDNTLLICNANWQCLNYNRMIKNAILFHEEFLEAGDRLMIVKNYYDPEGGKDKMSFVANGDMAELRYLSSEQEKYGLRFADGGLKFPDYSENSEVEFKLLLDVLFSKGPALEEDKSKELYRQVVEHHQQGEHKGNFWLEVKKDPYLNALQVKHAYAVTCHKSQGGQWDAVFIDGSHLHKDDSSAQALRWLYTAMTRAVKEVFLINFPTSFFPK